MEENTNKISLGNKYSLKDGKVIDTRRYIKLDSGKWMLYAVYVAQHNPEICGEWFKGCEVHHKDGNGLNDDPNNLICLSAEEHRMAHKLMNNKRVEIYKNGQYETTVFTQADAARYCQIPASYISGFLCGKPLPKKGKYCNSGYTFKYAS